MDKLLAKRVLLIVLLTIGMAQRVVAREADAMHQMNVSPRYVAIDGVECKTADELKRAVEGLPAGSKLRWFTGCFPWRELPVKPQEIKVSEFKSFCSGHGVELIIDRGW